ncbi:MAG: branched-chain amino acid aminotransferase [Alphaproteobacteria bacterium]|nr:branched-chain amino acid aminotransferase [Alphaproteobacteria bacterium]
MAHEPGRAITWLDGEWHEGNPLALGPMTHGVWLGSVVFDGARAVQGLAPDLARHMARSCFSARFLGLEPMLTPVEIEGLAWEGIHRFKPDAELYICPLFWADSGFALPDPASTRFALSVYEAPLPKSLGFSACLSSFRRPARDAAPTEAKAACLYPNVSRIVREAGNKGFDTAAVLDPCGNLAEFAYTNLFLVRQGVVHTPAINGTFLNGITRQRVIALLRDDGLEVVERAIAPSELMTADEIFATGNYAKLQPCLCYETRNLSPGPVYERARALYWDFAKRGG